MEYVQRDSPSAFAAARMEGGGAAGDDLFVDDLLDFSNGFSETEEQQLEMGTAETSQGIKEAAPPPPPDDGSFSGILEFQPLEAEEGFESLEWLSHFVEDSFSDYSFAGEFPAAENKPETAATERQQPWFATAIQTKARTKRNRAGLRVRPVLSPSFVDSPTSSTSSTLSTTSFPSLPSQADDSSLRAKKKPKRKPADGGAAQPRRCSHCGVTKTPQWRAGPQGSKTLCNACGVRFKTGRLLPEYRPASSPTFSSEMHSNHHRKVLEMRRKKEVQADAGLDPPKTGMVVAGLS